MLQEWSGISEESLKGCANKKETQNLRVGEVRAHLVFSSSPVRKMAQFGLLSPQYLKKAQ